MKLLRRARNERGIALITVLLVALVVGTISVGAALVSMNASLINRFTNRQNLLESIADAGLEEGRSRVNGDGSLYPDTGYAVLENGIGVTDASAATIPNVTRYTYVGPTGVTSGQYGVFGSVVVIAQDAYGNRVIRRGEMTQESFAKYAYFTDIEPSYISFGGGDQITGPVHTNDLLKIYSSGASFFGTVTTAKTVVGARYGTFAQGYTEGVGRIEMPETADLLKLQRQAQAGQTAFVGDGAGGRGAATLRIEFVAIDLNGDGAVNGSNEGFFRMYRSSDPGWVVADRPADYRWNGLRNSRNCGHYHPDGEFIVAADHPRYGPDSWVASVTNVRRRCYLGGSDSLFGGFLANDGKGQWVRWPGSVSPLLTGRPDAAYLFPITRQLNPSFKGVIFVEGKVALSGVLRGRVTVAATDEISFADDITYATDPGAGTCNDILGVFSGGNIVVADNTLNAPVVPARGQNWFTYDDTRSEFIHGVLLALGIFTVDNYARGATRAQRCEGRLWGRGCLYLSGGIIQSTRGAVGTIWRVGGTGYVKRYSYDACAYSDPPPYFPTTGHFARGRYFEVNPVGFDVGAFFRMLTAPAN